MVINNNFNNIIDLPKMVDKIFTYFTKVLGAIKEVAKGSIDFGSMPGWCFRSRHGY